MLFLNVIELEILLVHSCWLVEHQVFSVKTYMRVLLENDYIQKESMRK